MSAATVDKYVAKRADLLARLVLTERKGVQVFPYPEGSDTGIDLIVHLPAEGHRGKLKPYLFAQVKGVSESLEDERRAASYCKPLWKPLYAKGFFLAPAVFLLFSVEGDQGYFSWVLEPQVGRAEGPTLTWVEAPEMTKITRSSIGDMLDAVENWFVAMSDHLLRDKSDR